MKHPLISASRSLAATVLIALGLGIYGCGDTASTTEPAVLGNLSVTEGTLEPPFNPATTSYTVQLSIGVSSTTITATPQVAGDTIRIDNQQISSQTVSLSSPGAEQTINIVVTDTGTGGTSRSYTVRVTRANLNGNNSLNSLAVSRGSLDPEFEADVLRYAVNVSNNIGSINITPTLSDPAATMTVNGEPASSGQARTINLGGGGQITTITVAITAQNGNTKSYVVSVSRGPSNISNLRGLTISPGRLDFKASTTSYPVNLPASLASNVTSVRVTPTLRDTTASMTVNGQPATSGQTQSTPLPAPGSKTVITIIVTAQDGTSKTTYSVNVNRAALGGNNNLSDLTVSPGAFDSPFDADDPSYTVQVESDVNSVTVTPTLESATSTMTVNSQATSSGQAVPVTLNSSGQNTSITIIVTAQNGNKNTYVIVVIKAASNNSDLSALTVTVNTTAQRLSPRFNRGTLNYRANVSPNIENVTVSATKSDRNADMTIGDVLVPAGTRTGEKSVTLGGEDSDTPVFITVTAPSEAGVPKRYSLTIHRNARSSNNDLSALSVTAGTTVLPLSPPFDSNTVNVDSNVINVTVTAMLEDTNATMEINGQGTSSGVPSAPITLGEPGSSTDIPILVTAPNGDEKPYTITVKRAEAGPTKPPKPTAKPDLIPEDDFCTPDLPDHPDQCFIPPVPGVTNSREDNITNVKRPRFSVPQPDSGETAKLYLKNITTGEEFSSSNSGNKILSPNADLSDGLYDVTYTLSNSGGESDKSDPMTPKLQIDTNIK